MSDIVGTRIVGFLTQRLIFSEGKSEVNRQGQSNCTLCNSDYPFSMNSVIDIQKFSRNQL